MTKHNLKNSGLPEQVIIRALSRFNEKDCEGGRIRAQVLREIADAVNLIKRMGGNVTWHSDKTIHKHKEAADTDTEI